MVPIPQYLFGAVPISRGAFQEAYEAETSQLYLRYNFEFSQTKFCSVRSTAMSASRYRSLCRKFEDCYVVNDKNIDEKDKLTIHSIFEENNLVEKPGAEEIIKESTTKDIIFEKSKDCPIGLEVLSLPVELGEEKR